MSDETITQNVGDVIKPLVTPQQAADLISKFYGLEVISVSELNSYDDRNFKIVVSENGKYETFVLKIANSMDSNHTHNLEVQNLIMTELQKIQSINVQNPKLSINGKSIELENFLTPVNTKGEIKERKHAVRLLTYIPGELLKSSIINKELAREIGEVSAVLDLELKKLSQHFTNVNIGLWNLANVVRLDEFVYAVEGEKRQNLIKEIVQAFKSEVVPTLEKFTKGVIHGDLNEQNIITQKAESSSQWRVAGILDWQDCCFSYPAFELGITLFYVLNCLPPEDLTTSIKHIGRALIEGYLSKYHLNREEILVLPLLAACRAAQSLCLGEYSYREIDSSNEYFLVTATAGWRLLEEIWVKNKAEISEYWLKDFI